MLWTRSLCLSALPSYRAPDEVIRTVTGVARLHCLYLAGVSVVRCQIVFTVVVYLLSVSVFQILKLFSPGRVSVYPCRVRTGLYSLPELETLHCRVYCTCTADDICTSTVFGVCTCTASLSHLHCVLELSNKDYLFSLAIGSRAFCTVTHTPAIQDWFCAPGSQIRKCNEKGRNNIISWMSQFERNITLLIMVENHVLTGLHATFGKLNTEY